MPPLPTGTFRRRIVLHAADRRSIAAVEDDFHHFRVELEHDGEKVTAVRSEGVRPPWDLCASAGERLREFIGVPIAATPTIDPERVDYHWHCTHQYDLACLAIAQAARGGRRQYDIAVPDDHRPPRPVRLLRDGEPCLDLALDGSVVTAPPRYAGLDLRRVGGWSAFGLDADTHEALRVLRRGVMVSGGRGIDLDAFDDNSSGFEQMTGACFVFQPVNMGKARRYQGNSRNFSDRPDDLLRDMAPAPLHWRSES
jgi:hypothetical protein